MSFHTPLVSPNITQSSRPDPIATSAQPNIQNTSATPIETPTAPNLPPGSAEKPQNSHLQPARSPAASLHSRSSVTDHSEFDTLDNAGQPATDASFSPPEKEKKRSRWRFSSSAKRGEDYPLSPPPPIGSNVGARGSNSSFGSSRPRKSFTGDSGGTAATQHEREGSMGGQTLMGASTYSRESGELLRDVTNVNTNSSGEEKKGLFGKWKAKMSERSEQKKLEKERAKSPPGVGHGQSRSSLSSTVASAGQGQRGRSLDVTRGSQSSEGGAVPPEGERPPLALETVTERPQTEARERADMSGLSQAQAPPVPAVPQQETEKSVEATAEGAAPMSAESAPAVVAPVSVDATDANGQRVQGDSEKAADTTPATA